MILAGFLPQSTDIWSIAANTAYQRSEEIAAWLKAVCSERGRGMWERNRWYKGMQGSTLALVWRSRYWVIADKHSCLTVKWTSPCESGLLCMLKVILSSNGDYTEWTQCARSLEQNVKRLNQTFLKEYEQKHSPRSLDTFHMNTVQAASHAWAWAAQNQAV